MTTAKKTTDAVNELEAFFARKEMLTSKAWRPEIGDVLVGEVAGFRLGEGDHGTYPIVIIRPKDGGDSVSVHCFHTLIKEGFAQIKVAKGMRVAVHYDGMQLKNSAADKPVADREKTDYYAMYFVANLDDLNQEETVVSFE